MPLKTKAVANFFLEQGFNESVDISPMKLQKLLYYGQGWHLGFTGDLLFNEQIECWLYGPVVRSIFKHFEEFGSMKIERLAYARSDDQIISPAVPQDCLPISKSVLAVTWAEYKKFSAIKLSNMTHATDGPWDKVYQEFGGNLPIGTDIPIPVIRDHFKALLAKGNLKN